MRSNSVLTRLLLATSILMPTASHALSLVVTSSGDDSSVPAGVIPVAAAACPATTGLTGKPCTLRAALETIQAGSDATNTITLQVQGVVVQSALPTITKSINFVGAVPGSTTGVVHVGRFSAAPTLPAGTTAGQYCAATSSNATGSYRLFTIAPTTGAIAVSFQKMAICYGNVVATAGAPTVAGNSGGGILVGGAGAVALTLNTVLLSSNVADFGGGLAVTGSGSGAKAVQIGGSVLSPNAASYGGAIYFTPVAPSSLAISTSILNGNTAAISGGAVFYAPTAKSPLTIAGSTLNGNIATANVGGALYFNAAVSAVSNEISLAITGSQLGENQALDGGAVYVDGAANVSHYVSIDGSLLDGNTATSGLGGAIHFTPKSASTLNLNNVRLLQNQAAVGGALAADNAPHSVVITGSSLAGNAAVGTGGAGGAIYASLQFPTGTPAPSAGTLNIIASTIGPYFPGGVTPTLTPSNVAGNSAKAAGGGLFIDKAQLVLQRSFVVANTAPAGAAVAFATASTPAATLIGNTIARNLPTATDATGVAVFAASSAVLPATDANPFVGNIIADNGGKPGCSVTIGNTIANTGGYNLSSDSSCFASTLVENLVRDPSVTPIFWDTRAGYNTTVGASTVGGFVSRGLSPSVLPLVAESPAIDVVMSDKILANNLNLDQRGAGIADGNQDGTAVKDIGAYEFGALGLVGFSTGTASGYAVTEPVSGDTSVAIAVQNYGTAASPTVKPLVRTVDLSQTAFPKAIAPGTALADVAGTQRDYAPVPAIGTALSPLTIAGGATDTSTAVIVHSDKETEPAETVTLLLDGLYNVDYDALTKTSTSFCLQSGGSLYFPCVTQTLTITDAGAQAGFQFQVAAQAINEGGTTATSLNVFRTGPTNTSATVTCFAASSPGIGSATQGSDYSIIDPATGTPVSELLLTFPVGATSVACPIYAYADSIVEGDETFVVGLRDPSAGTVLASGSSVTVTIKDKTVVPSTTFRLDAAAYTVSETAGALQVTVIRSGPSNLGGSVTVSTQSGSAITGTDFSSVSTTLTWVPGDLPTKTVSIPIINNSKVDIPTRQFTVKLSSPMTTGTAGDVALASPEAGQVTITDDEADAASASITVSKTAIVINGAGNDSYTVTLNKTPTKDVVIALQLPLESGAFLSTPSLTFAANTTTLTQTVTVYSGGDPGNGITKTGTITQTVSTSDPVYTGKTLPSISVQVRGVAGLGSVTTSTNSIAITGAGSKTYTISVNAIPTQDVVVSFSTNNANVIASFNGLSSVTFPAGGTNLSRTITVLSSRDPGVDGTGAPVVVNASISHVVTTTDPAFTGKTVAPVAVVVTGSTPTSDGGGSGGGSGGGAFGWSSLLMLGSAFLFRRRRIR